MTPGTENNEISLHVYVDGEQKFESKIDRHTIIGRQRTNEPNPFVLIESEAKQRLIIASHAQTDISRTHISLEPLGASRLRITNLSSVPVMVEPWGALAKESHCTITLPARIQIANVLVRLEGMTVESGEFSPLRQPTIPPPRNALVDGSHLLSASGAHALMETLGSSFDSAQGEVLLKWLRSTSLVFQNAASSPHFLPLAVQAVHQIVGLQYAVALTHVDGRWSIETDYGMNPGAAFRLSSRLLDKLLQEKRTFVYKPEPMVVGLQSLAHVEAVVAAPILDEFGEVVGALYATKLSNGDPMSVAPDITTLEASLVELIASGVAAGWARLKHEQAAIKARIQFEQFFGPDLAAKLETDPELLKGRDTEITVMFCDVVGFSRISEKFDAAITLEWINEVLGAMSECVIREGGVLVDYVGDELMAMWGAPFDYRDHPQRAIRAGIAIQEKLDALSQQWLGKLGESFSACTGINSGIARVGNVGSSWKFKYGALGNTVNLGARVRGLTKHFQCRTIVTRETVSKLTETRNIRRLGQVQVVNIEEPLGVYELYSNPTESQLEWGRSYEQALKGFEANELHLANEILQANPMQLSEDGPSRVLHARIQRILSEQATWSPVWRLDQK